MDGLPSEETPCAQDGEEAPPSERQDEAVEHHPAVDNQSTLVGRCGLECHVVYVVEYGTQRAAAGGSRLPGVALAEHNTLPDPRQPGRSS